MKKILCLVLGCIFLISIAACNSSSDGIDNVEINIGTSIEFTEEEIQQAIDVVREDFFEGAEHIELHSLSYDEEFSNREKESCGNVDVDDPSNKIIVSSDFYVDRNAGGAWNPNTDYNWMFILFRDDENSNWILDDWGY